VHHPEYYKEGKQAATDFDSPIPAPQIAVQGSFYFVIEGDPAWSKLAKRLLEKGLSERGIGAKRSSGYGFFAV
jgi:CRISPR-associated protein Cmr6